MLHPGKGADIACQLPLSSRVPELILSHHEHLDGSGYPRGIGGELLERRWPGPGRGMALDKQDTGTPRFAGRLELKYRAVFLCARHGR